jgi:hypothetical protein
MRFWVHGYIDNHSLLIIYLECQSSTRLATVAELFLDAVEAGVTLGWKIMRWKGFSSLTGV